MEFREILKILENRLNDSEYENFNKIIRDTQEEFNIKLIESPSRLIFQRSEWLQKIKLCKNKKKIEILEELRKEISYYIKEKNVSNKIISNILGISQSLLSKIINEGHYISISIKKANNLLIKMKKL